MQTCNDLPQLLKTSLRHEDAAWIKIINMSGGSVWTFTMLSLWLAKVNAHTDIRLVKWNNRRDLYLYQKLLNTKLILSLSRSLYQNLIQLIHHPSTRVDFVLGFAEVHMWLKYCPLLGYNSYELIMNATNIQLKNL